MSPTRSASQADDCRGHLIYGFMCGLLFMTGAAFGEMGHGWWAAAAVSWTVSVVGFIVIWEAAR